MGSKGGVEVKCLPSAIAVPGLIPGDGSFCTPCEVNTSPSFLLLLLLYFPSSEEGCSNGYALSLC